MKKIFTLFAAVAVSLAAFANEYTGKLTVMINGEGPAQDETITITKDSTNAAGFEVYTLSIKNFTLISGETEIPVGNIVVSELVGYEFNGKKLVLANEVVKITEGDKEGVDMWLGPTMLEDGVPVSLVGKFDETTALVDIVIDMRNILEQFIYVNFDNNAAPGPQPEPGKKGDLNGDGSVNAGDVSALYELILNPEE